MSKDNRLVTFKTLSMECLATATTFLLFEFLNVLAVCSLQGVFIGDCPEAAFFTNWAIIWLRGLAPPSSVAAFAPGLSKLPNGWRTHLTHCRNSCPNALSWGSFHASGSWLVNSTPCLAAKSAALFNRPSSTNSCLYLSFNRTKAGKSDTPVLVNSLMTTFDVLLTLQASFITTSQLFPQTPTRLFHHPFASFFFSTNCKDWPFVTIPGRVGVTPWLCFDYMVQTLWECSWPVH